ncbi:hypothetical protein SUGI_0563960 [Cryptomeria japonica]|nr:hypothetical protein SUGI_0563960 [Cryptomeria japonica]
MGPYSSFPSKLNSTMEDRRVTENTNCGKRRERAEWFLAIDCIPAEVSVDVAVGRVGVEWFLVMCYCPTTVPVDLGVGRIEVEWYQQGNYRRDIGIEETRGSLVQEKWFLVIDCRSARVSVDLGVGRVGVEWYQ